MKSWKNYQGIFNGFFIGMGLKTEAEKANSQGRIDYVLKFKDLHIIIELKYSQEKSIESMLNEAWAQIAKKRYYQAYQDKNMIILAIVIKDTENTKEVQCQIKNKEEVQKLEKQNSS
jgi:hypothetical protein